jgi:cytoskeletal protein RodZ
MPVLPDDEKDIEAASGRDPLEPEELAAPPEPPEPERSGRASAEKPQRLSGPPRLRETSVRRIDHRGGEVQDESEASGAAPAEQAATLGETLANERRRQGKGIADVEAATRIRGKLIEALEHGEYDALPSPAYVKGYIQSYASYLEMPAGPLIAQYNAETAGRPVRGDEHPYIKMPVAGRLSGALPQRRQGRERRPYGFHLPGPVWVWVLVLVLVIVGIIGIGRLLARSEQSVPPLPPGGSTATTTAPPSGIPSTPTAAATTSAEATTLAAGVPKPPAGMFVVQVRTKLGPGTTLRIRSDGVIKYDKFMAGGQKQTTFAKDTVSIRAADQAQLLSVTRDGVPFDIPPANASGGVLFTIPKP